MKSKMRIKGPMDGHFGEPRFEKEKYIVWLDYIFAKTRNHEQFARLFAQTIEHEELEMFALEELGIPAGENVWSIDYFEMFWEVIDIGKG